jgi:L-aspartate oxidase
MLRGQAKRASAPAFCSLPCASLSVSLKLMNEPSRVDFLVMGAGVAGLRAAVELARYGDVLVVTKESVAESNTHYAQGGIAVALEGRHDVELHLEDTLQAGDGLVYQPAAEVLVDEGPQRVAELIEWGAHFDREAGRLLRTREGAHSLPRILHANGDATGAEISRALAAFARASERIRFAEWTMVTRLVTAGGRVVAADLASLSSDPAAPPVFTRISTRAVLIAAGGAGQVYSDTTNPAVATGDGIALAHQAGADLADMEFYQFHPTAFSLAGAPRFLISEAVRGEGAWLRNHAGERFMEHYHPRLELAPRDVVARAIAREGTAPDGSPLPVFLDMRHVRDAHPRERFPGISAFLAGYHLDLSRDLIPVRPAAHYLMGGIRTDLDGRTSVSGLYAAGEAACTGVHGANRLASNSLLEGLVFGARAAQCMLAEAQATRTAHAAEPHLRGPAPEPLSAGEEEELETLIAPLQSSMWANAGLLREETALRKGLADQAEIAEALTVFPASQKWSRRLAEAQSLAIVSRSILGSALARTESRGAHFRNDHPHRDDANFRKHSVFERSFEVSFEVW